MRNVPFFDENHAFDAGEYVYPGDLPSVDLVAK